MSEKPPSIMCETCGGWHPTEAHAQFEKEASERRMAEIKVRPDSAYRFDTLGFSSEKKGEIEPWMHEVIEKAKELGDDLQDSDTFVHMELWSSESDEAAWRLLKIVEKGFFTPHPERYHDQRDNKSERLVRGGELNARPHNAGTKFMSWGFPEETERVLIAQEKYLKTRTPEDLEEYKNAIRDDLKMYGDKDEKNNPLETTEERKRAVEHLIKNIYGIILAFPKKIESNPEFLVEKHGSPYSEMKTVTIYNREPRRQLISYPDLSSYTFREYWYTSLGPRYTPQKGTWRHSPETEIGFSGASTIKDVSEETLKKLSFDILNGLYVKGGIENQRKILERMLEMTKDHPERRLPIYNFYGKLAWPRPPEK